MGHVTFPRWAAPLVGAGAGAFLGVRESGKEGEFLSAWWLLLGATLGLLAGCLIWLLDPPGPGTPIRGNLPGSFDLARPARPETGSLIGRLLALLSLPLSFAPVLGLVMALAASLANRRTTGWPRTLSRVSLALSLLMTLVLGAVIALAPGH